MKIMECMPIMRDEECMEHMPKMRDEEYGMYAQNEG